MVRARHWVGPDRLVSVAGEQGTPPRAGAKRADPANGAGPASAVERRLADQLAFLRRRLTGDYPVDGYGFDPDFAEHATYPALRPLYRRWFRVATRGLENVPDTGAALIVANHSGTLPLDALMTALALFDEHPAHRHLRMLGADLLFQAPPVADLARRSGVTLACQQDAEGLLRAGALVGVWPEGFKGIGKPFQQRYRLQRFGRGGFVAAAVRAGAPIIPCAVIGAEETYPLIANARPIARLLGLPYAPVTATFPWLGLLGAVPLPTKWVIAFGEPISPGASGPEAAQDPAMVFELADRVRAVIGQMLCDLLTQRRGIFG